MENMVKYPSEKKMNNINKLFKEVSELVKGTGIEVSSPKFEVNGDVNEYTFLMKNGHVMNRIGVVRFLENVPDDDVSENYIIDDFITYDQYENFTTLKRYVLGLV